jgi:hypothetical protein
MANLHIYCDCFILDKKVIYLFIKRMTADTALNPTVSIFYQIGFWIKNSYDTSYI